LKKSQIQEQKFAQPEIDVNHLTRLDCGLEYCRGDG